MDLLMQANNGAFPNHVWEALVDEHVTVHLTSGHEISGELQTIMDSYAVLNNTSGSYRIALGAIVAIRTSE